MVGVENSLWCIMMILMCSTAPKDFPTRQQLVDILLKVMVHNAGVSFSVSQSLVVVVTARIPTPPPPPPTPCSHHKLDLSSLSWHDKVPNIALASEWMNMCMIR